MAISPTAMSATDSGIDMSRHEPPQTPDPRRAAARRTVWTLAVVAALIYGYFIVKTIASHNGA